MVGTYLCDIGWDHPERNRGRRGEEGRENTLGSLTFRDLIEKTERIANEVGKNSGARHVIKVLEIKSFQKENRLHIIPVLFFNQKWMTGSNHGETSDNLKVMDSLQNNKWPGVFKYFRTFMIARVRNSD